MSSKRKYLLILIAMLFFSCEKNFLDIKSDKKLVIPEAIEDYRALLDKSDLMNQAAPYLGFISADNYFMEFSVWDRLPIDRKNAHVWNKNIFDGTVSVDWNNGYQQVFHANIVLEGLRELQNESSNYLNEFNEVKGSAYFYRAFAFYQLSQLFCEGYDAQGQNNGLGIPLRLSSDINIPTVRSTVSETYSQIIADLEEALKYLPQHTSMKTRPNQRAAHALLSRIYLLMQDYEASLEYANVALEGVLLIDFNELSVNSPFPMPLFNDEVIYHSRINIGVRETSGYIVDDNLYQSYDENDLRKKLWYGVKDDNTWFKGSYNGDPFLFNGLTVDELYVNKIECLVRLGETSTAVKVLNEYLVTRYDKSFEPFNLENIPNPLILALIERRRALAFRGLRWGDLKRLNLEGSTEVELTRQIEGVTYTLSPKAKNYVLPIPDIVIELSNIEQNERE